MRTLSIQIADKTAKRLDAIATANHESTETLIQSLLHDITDTDEARLEEYAQTGHGIPHEIATNWLRDLAAGNVRPAPSNLATAGPAGCGAFVPFPEPDKSPDCQKSGANDTAGRRTTEGFPRTGLTATR
ncbi:MAG TPA: hypothetical protein VI457_05660 [Methylococcaceae bacterium]|nr:hypothetical protein [Methylococcaceae bacterium]